MNPWASWSFGAVPALSRSWTTDIPRSLPAWIIPRSQDLSVWGVPAAVYYLQPPPGMLARWRRQQSQAFSLFPCTFLRPPSCWKVPCYKSDYTSAEDNEKKRKVWPQVLNPSMYVITSGIWIFSFSFFPRHSWRGDRSKQLCMSYSWSEILAMARICNECMNVCSLGNIQM